jgi:N-acetylneuraminic acid mutarotase
MSATETDFMSLSPQIHAHILSYLSMTDIYQGVACTSKRMNELCKRCYVWRGRYLKVKFEKENSPGPLLCHSAVVCKDNNGSHQMLCYGGNLSSTNIIENVKNDMWCYQFDQKKWIKSQSQSTSLTEHTSVVYKNTMFTFGGNGGLVDNYSNLVLTYPLPFKPENYITTHDSLPGAPQPRSAHTAVVYKNEMYIFGGWNGHESLNDFYCLNLDTLQWRQINSADCPSKRRMHSAVVHKDKMYIFGGYDESRPAQSYNELCCFDFLTETWKIVPCQGRIPIGRSRAAATIVGNNMYIIGGWDRVSHFGEVLRLDLEKYIWFQEKIDLNLKLAQQSCVVMEDSWMVMYGGKNEIGQDLSASTDMIVTRLSALAATSQISFDKKTIEQPVTPSIASIHS